MDGCAVVWGTLFHEILAIVFLNLQLTTKVQTKLWQDLPSSNTIRKDQPKERQAETNHETPSPKIEGGRCHAAWRLQYIYIYIYIYIHIYYLDIFVYYVLNPPTSPDRRVRVLLHFSYPISHISYSHSHNHSLSYFVSRISFEGIACTHDILCYNSTHNTSAHYTQLTTLPHIYTLHTTFCTLNTTHYTTAHIYTTHYIRHTTHNTLYYRTYIHNTLHSALYTFRPPHTTRYTLTHLDTTHHHAFEDGLDDFFQVSADRAGPCFVDVLASGWCWLGNALQACFWEWFGWLFPGVGWPGRAMFCRCFGFWVALAREQSPGMLLGMVWTTFSRCRLTGPGHVLSMFWLLGGAGQGMFSKHAFGNGLDDFFQVSADQAGQCFVDVLASGWRWPGNDLQACFSRWFGQFFPSVGWPGRTMFCQCFGFWVALAGECSPSMLLGMIWTTFSRCRPTGPGFVLSMFWLLLECLALVCIIYIIYKVAI